MKITRRILVGFGLVVASSTLATVTAFAADSGGGIALPPEAMLLAVSLPAILVGIGFPEWAHAWTAWKLGDSTAEEEGRLSLNPLDHFDVLGTILIVVGVVTRLPVIGWGKPVPVDPGAFRRPITDNRKVALAGPMMNLLIAGLALIVMFGLATILPLAGFRDPSGALMNIFLVFYQMIRLNFSLALFNMLPIPPLDGSKVLESFVSAQHVETLRQIEPMGIVIVYLLMQSGALDLPFSVLEAGISLLMNSLWLSLIYLAVVGLAWLLFVRSLRWFQ